MSDLAWLDRLPTPENPKRAHEYLDPDDEAQTTLFDFEDDDS